MYTDDTFREDVNGHICMRDANLFMWEALVDADDDVSEGEDDDVVIAEANLPRHKRNESPIKMSHQNMELRKSKLLDFATTRKSMMSHSLVFARKTNEHSKIELTQHTCKNGHNLKITSLEFEDRFTKIINTLKCNNCQKLIVENGQDCLIACVKKCKTAFCMDCLGCPSGHILHYAR